MESLHLQLYYLDNKRFAMGKYHVQGVASLPNDGHLRYKYQQHCNLNHLDLQDNQHNDKWQ